MAWFGGLDCCAAVEGRAGRSQRDHALSPLHRRGPVVSRARAVAGVCGVRDTLPGMDCCVLPLQCQDQIVPDCQDYQTPPYVDSWLQQMQVRVKHAILYFTSSLFIFRRILLTFSFNAALNSKNFYSGHVRNYFFKADNRLAIYVCLTYGPKHLKCRA